MSLACECYNDSPEWWWFQPDGYTTLTRKRRRRCKSCGALIDVGSVCAEFTRTRDANGEIEERIYGSGPDVPLPSWWHCERCADLFFSLTELGYCVDPSESMLALVKEYASEHVAVTP